MMLSARVHATNVSDDPVFVPRAHVVRPRSEAFVMVKEVNGNMHGMFSIPPGETTDLVAHFSITPAVRRANEDLRADVVFTDNFGDEHLVGDILFHCPPPPRPQLPAVPKETLSGLSSQIERDVASVLKAEVARYAQSGRGSGGIGSVHTVMGGRTFAGVPPEWREVGTFANQDILDDPTTAVIKSDNVDALIATYQRLQSQRERDEFSAAIVKRISKDTEYGAIAYLPLIVSLRTQTVSEVLRAAKLELRGHVPYGFDEFMRVLASLLRCEHPAFADGDLDEVEAFLEGLTEYSYGVNEKLAAVRAYRVRTR
jgi:hypothetical protein